MKMRKPKYERQLETLEKLAEAMEQNCPLFSRAVRQVVRAARLTRPKSIPIAVSLACMSADALERRQADVSRILLTAAFAMVSPRARSIFHDAATRMFNKKRSQGTELQGLTPMPPMEGVPPEVLRAINEAMESLKAAGLKDGLNVVKTSLGPIAITKLNLSDEPPPVPPCANTHLN